MGWRVETLDARIDEELLTLPADLLARFFVSATSSKPKGCQAWASRM